MTSDREPQQDTYPSPWTRPPEQPVRYWVPARLSDMLHGWLDGRRGIPQLPEEPSPSANGHAAQNGNGQAKYLSGPVTLEPAIRRFLGPGPVSPPPTVRTARIDVLADQARALIEEELIRFCDDWAVLKAKSADALRQRESSATEESIWKEKLRQAQAQLSEREWSRRRFAEQDTEHRPDDLVRARRQAAWERCLDAAEARYQSAAAKLADASHSARLQDDLIRDRGAVARAAARRHHALAHRRIATYLQQLVRSHRQGALLNRLLIEHPVGPDLPAWTKDPKAGQSVIERMLTEGGVQIIGDPYLSNEASSQ
jgi:hypothetical protein